MRTIAIVNLKGGVGKTATAVEMAYQLVTAYGKRVLIIDADQNRGATKLLLDPRKDRNTITGLLTGLGSDPYEFIESTQYHGLDIIAADEEMAIYGTNAFVRGDCHIHSLRDLCEALTEDDAYDYIIIDSAPGMAAPMVCTIVAADAIVIPMVLDFWGVSGMQDLVTQINGVRTVRPEVRIAGALVTKLQRDADTEADLTELRSEAPIHVYDTAIRHSNRVRACGKKRRCIQDISPRCAASVDYRAFVAEFLAKEGWIV